MAFNFVAASSQFLEIPGVGTFTAGKFSGGAWVRFSSIVAGVVISKTSSNALDQRQYVVYFDSGKWRISWRDAGGSYVEYTFNHSPSTGIWYHIAWTVHWGQSPDTVVGYLNGVSQSLTLTGINNSAPMTGATSGIGCFDQSDGQFVFWDGDIAEVFIFNELATADQIAALAKGYTVPSLNVRAVNVEAYAPLVRGKQELYQGRTITDGTAAATPSNDHPPVVIA